MSATDSLGRTAARLLGAAALVLCAACATPKPRDAYVGVQNKTPASRTMTSFSEALSCMDDLFVAHNVRGIGLVTTGIPDATGQVSAGTRDMLISAVSQMSRRSGAFRFADWDFANVDHQTILQVATQKFTPDFYIRGAISQLDQNVSDWRKGGGVSALFGDVGVGGEIAVDKNETTSVVALDLNLGRTESMEIMPGLSAANSLVVARGGRGAEASLTIKQVGAFYSVEMAQSEGMHQAVRTLIELGAVELLGKLAKVPYWRCLRVESTNPKVRAEAARWWNDMDLREQVLFVQRVLSANGYMESSDTGRMDDTTRTAITRFQVDHGLISSGRVGFDLYYRMLGRDRPLVAGPPKTLHRKRKEPDFARDEVPVRKPMAITLTTSRGPKPRYKTNEQLQLSVRVSANAYLYCYYIDGGGEVARIFPGPSLPRSYVAGGERVQIPGREDGFSILLKHPEVVEEVVCLASDRDVAGSLPKAMHPDALEPLQTRSMDAVIGAYRALDRTALAVARLPIEVAR